MQQMFEGFLMILFSSNIIAVYYVCVCLNDLSFFLHHILNLVYLVINGFL